MILSNDRAYSSWRRLHDNKGAWAPARWNFERRQRFLAEFGAPGLDLRLLVLFHRADNAYRRPAGLDESQDSVLWFENRLVEENLLADMPSEGRNERLNWKS